MEWQNKCLRVAVAELPDNACEVFRYGLFKERRLLASVLSKLRV